MKLFIFLYIALIVSAFSMGSKRPSEIPKPPGTEIAKPETPSIPNPGGFNVQFIAQKGYATSKESDLIGKASLKLNEVVKSACFNDFMTKAKLKQTNGRTNSQVLTHLLSFNEVVQVKMYYKKWGDCITCTTAVAYRQPPEKKINLNSSFFTEKRSICRWAATMAHESLGHSLGNYDHSYKWSVDREYSVPYKIGGAKEQYGSSAFEECCHD